MTTDNRTNEPTEAQVEAAAKAGHEYLRAKRPATHGPYDSWEELDEEYREYLRGIHRAALVAAARVAPQAESGHDWMTWEESGKNGTYCRNCGIWAGKSGGVACAPVQPSSTVDEAALIREAKAEARGEALIDAVQAHRKLHETYGSTSVCHGGIGGQAMTPHCAEICDNINAHLTEISAWDALELEAIEFSRARAAEYRKAGGS